MSTSRPPTPPARLPRSSEHRFVGSSVGPPCEWSESYYPSSYHPIHIGDILGDDGRYKVLRKLGYGSFSTVWLARDLSKEDGAEHRFVAVKVVVAKAGRAADLPEVKLYEQMASVSQRVDLDRYITKLLDTFEISGPNGTHACLVFEPMGPTVSSMVELLPQFVRRPSFVKVRYPLWMTKQIVRGALDALTFVHAHDMAHGDVQPGNFLFNLRVDLNNEPEAKLLHPGNPIPPKRGLTTISKPLERLDGKVDLWAPKQLYVPQPLADWANYGPGLSVKLSDLGGAYSLDNPPAKIVTPTGLRAPELVLKSSTNVLDGRALDIWSLGCLVFEFITGESLFLLLWIPGQTEEEEDDEHLMQMVLRLGPLRAADWARWTRSSLYFREDKDGQRVLFNVTVGKSKREGNNEVMRPEDSHPWTLETMEEKFHRLAPLDMSVAQARQVQQLIRRMLQYDPKDRPTAVEILQDPWFQGGDEGRGAT